MAPRPAIPPVPSIWRLTWLVLIQQVKLYELFWAWDIEWKVSLWGLRRRWREGDPIVGLLVRRLAGLLMVLMPASVFILAAMLHAIGVTVDWSGVAVGVVSGVGAGIVGGVALDLVLGVFCGVVGGVAVGVLEGFI